MEDRHSNNDSPLRRRRSAAATAEATPETRGKLARRTALLGLLLTATIAALTGRAGTTLALLTAHHTARGRVSALLLDVGGGDDFGGKVEPFTEVVEALNTLVVYSSRGVRATGAYLRSEGVVVVLPGELGTNVAAGVQGLHGLDDLSPTQSDQTIRFQVGFLVQDDAAYVEVLGVKFIMLDVEVLLGHEDALYHSNSISINRPLCMICLRAHTAEEVLVDPLAVFLGNKPGDISK